MVLNMSKEARRVGIPMYLFCSMLVRSKRHIGSRTLVCISEIYCLTHFFEHNQERCSIKAVYWLSVAQRLQFKRYLLFCRQGPCYLLFWSFWKECNMYTRYSFAFLPATTRMTGLMLQFSRHPPLSLLKRRILPSVIFCLTVFRPLV